MDTKEQLCAETSPCELEKSVVWEETQTDILFPDFIKSQSGTGITFYNRQKVFPSRVRYGSTATACLAEVPVTEPGAILEKYMAQGFLEDQNGDFNQELTVPVEFVTLPSGENCVVLLTDLSSYVRGFSNLQKQDGVTSRHMFGVLSKLSNAICCLKDNDLYLSKWDGHHFYFSAQYGVFTLVLDGEALSEGIQSESEVATNKALAATLLYCLIGAFPVTGDGVPYGHLIDAPSCAVIRFDGTNKSVITDDPSAAAFWETLPIKLKDAFEACFFDPEAPCQDARQWVQLFYDLADTVESECCFHCGKAVFSGIRACPFCQGDLDKRNLLSKWLVTDKSRSLKFGLALPVNAILDYATLSSDLPKGKLLQIGYSAKRNILALKNISSATLAVDYGELGTIDVPPQTLFSLKSGMQFMVSQKHGITLTLLGFDLQDSWEVK